MPDVVVEVVSNLKGGKADVKLRDYARVGVPYYVIHDPNDLLGGGVLRVFGLRQRTYDPIQADWLPEVGLGLALWQGKFENEEALWLRWCDRQGVILPTGAERAEKERHRAEEAEQRAELLAAQLRVLGIQPPQ